MNPLHSTSICVFHYLSTRQSTICISIVIESQATTLPSTLVFFFFSIPVIHWLVCRSRLLYTWIQLSNNSALHKQTTSFEKIHENFTQFPFNSDFNELNTSHLKLHRMSCVNVVIFSPCSPILLTGYTWHCNILNSSFWSYEFKNGIHCTSDKLTNCNSTAVSVQEAHKICRLFLFRNVFRYIFSLRENNIDQLRLCAQAPSSLRDNIQVFLLTPPVSAYVACLHYVE